MVETIIDESNPAATLSELFKLAISEGLPPLTQRVAPEKKAALEQAISEYARRERRFGGLAAAGS